MPQMLATVTVDGPASGPRPHDAGRAAQRMGRQRRWDWSALLIFPPGLFQLLHLISLRRTPIIIACLLTLQINALAHSHPYDASAASGSRTAKSLSPSGCVAVIVAPKWRFQPIRSGAVSAVTAIGTTTGISAAHLTRRSHRRLSGQRGRAGWRCTRVVSMTWHRVGETMAVEA